jgi:hypothetical protein
VSQLTVGSAPFVALRDDAGNGAVKCPDVGEPTPAGADPSAFGRTRLLLEFPTPPPPAVTHLLTIHTTPGGTFTVMPPPVEGRYAEGTVVTVTAMPGDGFVATLSGFDAPQVGLIGTVTMNADRVVAVNFTPEQKATTVTFSTAALFRCANTPPGLLGCDTPSIASQGIVVSFAPAQQSVVANPSATTTIGDLLVSCPGGECGQFNFNTAGVTLEILVAQSSPITGASTFGGNGVLSGVIQLFASTALLAWAPPDTLAEVGAGPSAPLVRYEITPASFAVPQGCGTSCGQLPPNRLAITATVRVFN